MDGVIMLSTDSYFIKAWNGFHSDIVFFYCYIVSVVNDVYVDLTTVET